MATTELGRVGSYQLIRRLGEGSQGTTYLAEDDDGTLVALKELRFDKMEGWKALELFEREAQTLRNLDHFAVPKFVDAFSDDGQHFLAQEYIEGESLNEIALPFPPDLVERCARDMLEVLDYLHHLVPPVVHRDIKPNNIIRRPNGSHVLVDFGGVQLVLPDDIGGSTVIGTTGYMPAEQLVGRATPQSDLYGLGATLVHLVTGEHPSTLPTARMKLVWSNTVAPRLQPLLDGLLEPVPEDRPKSAADARLLINAQSYSVAAAQPTLPRTNTPDMVGRSSARTSLATTRSRPLAHSPHTRSRRVTVRNGKMAIDLSGVRVFGPSRSILLTLTLGITAIGIMALPLAAILGASAAAYLLGTTVFRFIDSDTNVHVDGTGFGVYRFTDDQDQQHCRDGRLWCSGRYLMFGTRQQFEVIGEDVPLEEMLVVLTDVARFLADAQTREPASP